MKKFRLSKISLARLEEIAEHTEENWGIAQSEKYLDALDASFHAIAQSPRKGRPHDDLGKGISSCQDRGAHHFLPYR